MKIAKWMINNGSFRQEFWRRIGELRKKGDRKPYRVVFHEMNEECYNETGSYRYSSYDSFRVVRDRRNDHK